MKSLLAVCSAGEVNRGDARRLLAALIVGAAVVAYLPALQADFIWDDNVYVLENRDLRSAEGLRRIWFEPRVGAQYYPVVFSSFWLEYQLWGISPVGYHLINVLLHGASGVLLWLLLRELSLPGALLGALIFAVHPVQVESVAWITERKNVLSGFLSLGALLVYLRGALSAGDRAGLSPARLAAAFSLFVLAMLSKTATVGLPVVILLLLWWKKGRLGLRDLLPLLPLLGAGAALALNTAWIEKGLTGAQAGFLALTPAQRLLVAGRALWFYLGKLLWPHPLIFNYPRWEVDPAASWQYLFPLAFLGALALLWLARSRVGRAPLAFALAYAVTLSPALGFVNFSLMFYSFVADHLVYQASPWAIAPVAAVATLGARRFGVGRRVCLAAASALVLLLGTLTWRQCLVYRDRESLWKETLRLNPGSWLAHNNLGLVLEERGDFVGAERAARAAAALRPDLAFLRMNVGVALALQGRTAEAAEHYRAAVEKDPAAAKAWNNLGEMAYLQGRPEEAWGHFERALAAAPELPEAHKNLAIVLRDRGRSEEALGHLREAVRLAPDYALAYNYLGMILSETGRPDEALGQFALALGEGPGRKEAGKPARAPSVADARKWRAGRRVVGGAHAGVDYASIHNNLGNALLSLGRHEEAQEHFEEALALRPAFAEAHYNLGVVLYGLGRLEEAVASYRRSIALAPGRADTYNNLGVALWDLGRPAEAVDAYRRALEAQPAHPDARANLASALSAPKVSPRQP